MARQRIQTKYIISYYALVLAHIIVSLIVILHYFHSLSNFHSTHSRTEEEWLQLPNFVICFSFASRHRRDIFMFLQCSTLNASQMPRKWFAYVCFMLRYAVIRHRWLDVWASHRFNRNARRIPRILIEFHAHAFFLRYFVFVCVFFLFYLKLLSFSESFDVMKSRETTEKKYAKDERRKKWVPTQVNWPRMNE